MSVTIPIVSTPEVLGGKPRIEGTRIAVDQVGRRVREEKWDRERVLDAFGLSGDEFDAALDYFDAHPKEMAAIREQRTETIAEIRAQSRASEP
jgi:uncharacterized protein (DUF433 family)